MTHDDVQRWLDAYIEAWRTYDPQLIGDLFTEDAAYRFHPWDEPVRGRQAIVDAWLANQDPPGSWDARYEPVVVEASDAVATGVSRYFDGEGKLVRVYHNLWIVRFDAGGRCREFTEWFMKAPDSSTDGAEPPSQ